MSSRLNSLSVSNEFFSLKKTVVCWGENIPLYKNYKSQDPEFTKYHPYSWDKDLLLNQQEKFFKCLEKYKVKLIFPQTSPKLLHQMFTRDTAFVVGDNLYYSTIRKFKVREGELANLLKALNLPSKHLVPIDNEIEGGDVIVNAKNQVYIGHGSRTSLEAIEVLSKSLKIKTFELGQNTMHLDTRLTVLPKNIALANVSAFRKPDLELLKSNYEILEVTDAEAKRLGINVLVINPETIVVPKEHSRIAKELKDRGFKIELLDYSEPINFGGSFRCTTLPLERE